MIRVNSHNRLNGKLFSALDQGLTNVSPYVKSGCSLCLYYFRAGNGFYIFLKHCGCVWLAQLGECVTFDLGVMSLTPRWV